MLAQHGLVVLFPDVDAGFLLNCVVLMLRVRLVLLKDALHSFSLLHLDLYILTFLAANQFVVTDVLRAGVTRGSRQT